VVPDALQLIVAARAWHGPKLHAASESLISQANSTSIHRSPERRAILFRFSDLLAVHRQHSCRRRKVPTLWTPQVNSIDPATTP
jgi:hypothetical protein